MVECVAEIVPANLQHLGLAWASPNAEVHEKALDGCVGRNQLCAGGVESALPRGSAWLREGTYLVMKVDST